VNPPLWLQTPATETNSGVMLGQGESLEQHPPDTP
jgi:hypothetical protein